MPKIFLDMDGVCVDLLPRIQEFIGVPEGTQHKSWEIFEEHYKDKVLAREKVRDFFESMDRNDWLSLRPTPEFESLLKWAQSKGEVIFLTAPPCYGAAEAAIGKMLWARDFAGSQYHVIVNRDKHHFAEADSILIDDKVENCLNFNLYGGTGYIWECSYNSYARTELPDVKFFDKKELERF